MRLKCVACSKTHEWTVALCTCGGPLDIDGFGASIDPATWKGRGLWRYATALPVPVEDAVSLGEGATPIIDDPTLGASFKAEYMAPTGSFKDRGASVALTHARRLGVTGVVEDSSGNAGAAVAAYAARAGMTARVTVPASIPPAKAAAIATLGAKLEYVEGVRANATKRAIEIAQKERLFYASHVTTPWFHHGTKTAVYEVFEEAGPDLYDAFVLPAAQGTLLLGLVHGLGDLKRAGLIKKWPRLYAVQASGFTAIADAVEGKGPRAPPNTIADGVQIANPPRLSVMAKAIRESGGGAATVDEAETRKAQDRLHRRGILVEPTSAIALAGIDRLKAEKLIRPKERVLAFLTGRFKAAPPPPAA